MSESMAKPINVKELIQKTKLLRKDAAQFFDISGDWKSFLATRLPEELAAQIVEVGRNPPELTVHVSSAAWSARVRYALAELDSVIRERDPAIAKVRVRVQAPAAPDGSSARRRR